MSLLESSEFIANLSTALYPILGGLIAILLSKKKLAVDNSAVRT